MMGGTHALSGAAVWLGACAASTAVGLVVEPRAVLAGAVLAAGAALLPDLDCPQATASRAAGAPSQWLSRRLAGLSGRVYRATRTGRDRRGAGTHRYLLHTWPFAVLLGGSCSAVAVAGRVGVALVLAVLVRLGLRGLFGNGRAWRLRARTAAVTVAALAWWQPPADAWWLGVPVLAGCLLHDLGDACTHGTVPLLWPIRWNGAAWHMVGMPRVLRFRTGGPVEAGVFVGLVVVAAGAGYWLARLWQHIPPHH